MRTQRRNGSLSTLCVVHLGRVRRAGVEGRSRTHALITVNFHKSTKKSLPFSGSYWETGAPEGAVETLGDDFGSPLSSWGRLEEVI